MIRREDGEFWILISQVDHARLAADLAAAWGNEEIVQLPLAEWLLPAVRDHDEGWRWWEVSPTITDDGLPRQFTEMSASAASEIWIRSIETSAAGYGSFAQALRRLRSEGGEVTPDDAVVLEAVLKHRATFSIERLTAQIVGDGELNAEAVATSLARLERKNVVQRLPVLLGGPAYEILVPTNGSSPLGGIWVSKHFCSLADGSKQNDKDDAELAVIDSFLAEQAAKRAVWTEAAREFAGEELERVIDTGFRYVQFFDRVSLWLCMALRSEPWDAILSSTVSLRFVPRSPREISVKPWPFAPAAVELSTPAVRIPRRRFLNDDDLNAAIADGERVSLRWVLTPGH